MKSPQSTTRKLTLIGSLACLAFAALSFSATMAEATLVVGYQQDEPAPFYPGSLHLRDEGTLAEIPGTFFMDYANLFAPGGIAIGPDGNIYVSGAFSGRIASFDGQTRAPLGLFADLNPITGGSTLPAKMAFAPNGNLYVSDAFQGNIHIFQGPTNAIPGQYVGPAIDDPFQPGFFLAFGFDPNSADPNNPDIVAFGNGPGPVPEIRHVDSTGATNFTSPPFPGFVQTPADLLFGPNGEMYVADGFGNQVVKFDDAFGTNGTQFLTFPDPPFAGTDPSNFPLDLLLMPDNTLMVALGGSTNKPAQTFGAIRHFQLDGTAINSVTDLDPVSALALLPNAVPEPSTGLLVLVGGVVAGVARKRRMRRWSVAS